MVAPVIRGDHHTNTSAVCIFWGLVCQALFRRIRISIPCNLSLSPLLLPSLPSSHFLFLHQVGEIQAGHEFDYPLV
jgi:hypothetical protein